jgi:CRP/FNR family transcriptional regulator, cyclic AMP receptor protein
VRPEPGSLLHRLRDVDAAALLELGVVRHFARAAILFREGDETDHVVVVRSGRVKIGFTDRSGREVMLAVRGPGDVLGEFAAIDGKPRSAAGEALEPVEAVVIPAQQFRELLADRPRIALALLEEVVDRVRDADRKRVEFGAVDTEGRVARRLVELAERFGEPVRGGVHIALRLTQDDLAGFTGRSREAVAKVLAAFRARGWVETGRQRVVVLDLDALRHRAG